MLENFSTSGAAIPFVGGTVYAADCLNVALVAQLFDEPKVTKCLAYTGYRCVVTPVGVVDADDMPVTIRR
jgi:hypothetical protein